MKSTLVIENVTKEFWQAQSPIVILKNVYAHFERGKSYAITGVSGTGKSTLLYLLSGLEKPTYGHVLFNGHKLDTFNYEEQRRFLLENIGLIFQFSYLVRELTVLENVMIKGLIAKKPENESKQRALELLEYLDIHKKAFELPGSLSGGEQQRVAIARALFLNPVFLLADEPTAHLDEHTKKLIIKLLLNYQREHEVGILVSTHDKTIADQMQIIYELHTGKLTMRELK